MHQTSSFSDFSLLQLRELLSNGPDAKHHDNLQGILYLKILRTARSNLLLPADKNGHWYFQTYQSCSFGLYYRVYLLLHVCLSEITVSENAVLYSVCIAIIFQYSYCVYIYFLILANMFRLWYSTLLLVLHCERPRQLIFQHLRVFGIVSRPRPDFWLHNSTLDRMHTRVLRVKINTAARACFSVHAEIILHGYRVRTRRLGPHSACVEWYGICITSYLHYALHHIYVYVVHIYVVLARYTFNRRNSVHGHSKLLMV